MGSLCKLQRLKCCLAANLPKDKLCIVLDENWNDFVSFPSASFNALPYI